MSFSSIFERFSPTVAIDVGSSSTLLFQRDRGVFLNEPSLAALSRDPQSGRRSVVALGHEARDASGASKVPLEVVRPFQHGVVSDSGLSSEIFRHLLRRVQPSWLSFGPRVVAGVPQGSSDVERYELRSCLERAGARSVVLVDSAVAAAFGAGLPVTEARGSLVLDIGASHVRIAAISMNGVVYARSLKLGGDALDAAISAMVRRDYGMIIGDRTAERIKLSLGAALPEFEDAGVEVRGYDVLHCEARKTIIADRDVYDALQTPLYRIVDLIRVALERTPPELASDIVEQGITLTGGGSLLKGLDRLVARETKLPVRVVSDPISVTVRGAGAMMQQPRLLRELAIH